MRNLLLFALLLIGTPLLAQTNQPTFQYVNVIPNGPCVGTPPIQIMYLTGIAYSCNNGTWGNFAGGGGGGGTPTGPAGGALAGFYPSPSLAADALAPFIPATSTVLKGTGIAGSAAAAIPGTDYVTPSQITSFISNPMASPGDVIVGGTAGAPTRLPANANPGQALLVSTAAASTVAPTTKTCAHQAASSANTSSCTWSTPPAAGETIFCSALNSASSVTYTLSDSASNTYTAYGSLHTGSTTSLYTQTFYTAPISSPVTTTTVTVPSGGSFMALQCNSANNIAASSPTDGQASVDVNNNPIQLSSPITTTVGGDYIYCSTGAYFATTLSAGPGFTGGSSAANNYLNQYTTQGAAGPITPIMGGSVSNAATMTCSAFKAGTAVTPPSTAWNQAASITDIQAANTDVVPVPPSPSGGDDYAALQLAINTGIAEGREVFIPAGAWHTSQGLVANSNSFRLRGNSANNTTITASASGYNTLNVGTGSISAINAGGYVRDIEIDGHGKPAVGSPNGVAALEINAMTQYVVDNVAVNNDDIGLDVRGNSFGANWHNIRGCFGGNCNVGLNLRNGNESGSDLSFYDLWLDGAFCAVCIAPNGGGYHFYSGQLNGGQGTVANNDAAGAVVLNYDYLTGSTSGDSNEDFHGVSFEGTNFTWIFRGYGGNGLLCEQCSMNPTDNTKPAIGLYKNTNLQDSRINFTGTVLSGYFSNANLLVMSGSVLSGPVLTEIATNSGAQHPTINGVYTYVTNMAYQSGVQALSVGSDQAGLDASGMWFGNNSGIPEYSTNQGGSWINFLVNPLTTLGDLAYGGASGALTRLAGNTSPTDTVLVSHAITVTTPTSKTCSAFNSGGSGNSATCTWSAAPAAGESVVCGVFNNASSTLTMTDSATDAYTAYGSPFTTTGVGSPGFSLTFYTAPLAGSITTTTVNSTSGSFLTVQCNTVNNMASSSPTDGQGSVNTNSTTIALGSPITTTTNGDFVFCSMFGQSGQNYTVGSGFTLGSTTTFKSLTQFKTQSTAGTITPTVTQGTNLSATMSCAAFKPGTSGTAQAPTFTNSPGLSAANMTNFPIINPNTLYSAAGTPLPSCVTGLKGALATVSDATTPSYNGTYTSGGAVVVPVVCSGSAWLTH